MDDYSGPAPEVANRILKSTLTVSDSSTDFQPSLRRVQYDLDEVNAQIKECVSSNTPELLEVVQSIQQTRKSTSLLDSDVDNVTLEYQRLQREFIGPYERLQRAHTAAQRLHQTSELVRACNWYLQLAKELDEAVKTSFGQRSGAASASTPGGTLTTLEGNIYTAATLVDKLEELLSSHLHLQSLAVIREHEKTLAPTRQKLVAMALDTVKENAGGKAALRNSVLTLCMFEKDKMLSTVDTLIRSSASSTVLSITRSVGSTTGFDSAWTQANEKAAYISELAEELSDCFMLTRAENKVGGPLTATFWKLVATNVGQKLHTMSVANPMQIKSMKSQGEHILESVADVEEISAVFRKYI